VITTVSNWIGAVRASLREMLFGLPPDDSGALIPSSRLRKPSRSSPAPEPPCEAGDPEQNEPAPVLTVEPAEPAICQPPESAPDFSWMRSHDLRAVIAADFAGLQCIRPDCGMRWPTAPEPQP
jgi:hypothetical protein